MKTFLVVAAILMPSMYFICSVYIICKKCRKDNYNKENDIVNPLLPRQLIHRDAHPGNILIQDGLAGFVDFDLSERNLRFYDVCYAATAVLSDCFLDNSYNPESWLNIYRWIIAGYNDVQPLTEAERKAAPYVLLANQFVCVSWFSQQAQYEDVFKTNVAMTKWLVEHFGVLGI